MRFGTSTVLRVLRAYAASGFVLLLGIGMTLLAYRLAEREARETDERRFQDQVNAVTIELTRRMDAYIGALVGARGLFGASEKVDRGEFHRFVANYQIDERFPGVQGIGFSRSLTRDEVPGFEQRVRDQGYPEFEVWPRRSGNELSSIVFLEPFDARNRRAFGYDMLSEPTRREAMQRARDTGLPAASGKITLVQEFGRDQQPGFNVYLPVYGVPELDGVDERREALRGWVYAPFRMGDLVSGIFSGGLPPLVDFTLYDGLEKSGQALLYTTLERPAEPPDAPHVQTTVIEIAGRPWTIEFRSRPEFLRDSPRNNPAWVLAGGLAITALLFAVMRAQGRARADAEADRERTAFLASSGRLLAKSLDYSTTLANLAQLAVPTLANGCAIDLKDESGELQNVAMVSDDPARVELAREMRRRFPPNAEAPTGIARVLRTGESQLIHWLSDEMREAAAIDEHHLSLMRKVNVRSMMSVPLLSRGQVLGAITVASYGAGRRFTQEDLELVEELARLASAAVDNARLYQRSQEAIRLRDEFLSVAGHELRTPLTSLHLKLQMLHRKVGAGEVPTPETIASIDRQVGRLTRLVESVLDLSRLSTGRLQLHFEEVELGALVADVVARSAEEAAVSHTPVELDAQPGVFGVWDPVRLEQVVTNLLSNALKYGAGKPVRLEVSAARGTATVVVRDQGIGIEPDAAERIFTRFERAVSVRHYGGLGLGLYIVRQMAEAMGGTVSVESEPGKGSTFKVELPQARAAAEPAPLGPPLSLGDGRGAGVPDQRS